MNSNVQQTRMRNSFTYNNLAVEKKAGHIKKSNEKNKKSNKVMFNSFDKSCCVDSRSLANNLILVLIQI